MAVAPVNSVALSDQLMKQSLYRFQTLLTSYISCFSQLVISQLPLLSWWRASMTDYFSNSAGGDGLR
jgi:hypothetical protein